MHALELIFAGGTDFGHSVGIVSAQIVILTKEGSVPHVVTHVIRSSGYWGTLLLGRPLSS